MIIEQLKMDLYRFTNDLNFKMPKEWEMYLVPLSNLLPEITNIPIYLNLILKLLYFNY
jgi:hypothetical protein